MTSDFSSKRLSPKITRNLIIITTILLILSVAVAVTLGVFRARKISNENVVPQTTKSEIKQENTVVLLALTNGNDVNSIKFSLLKSGVQTAKIAVISLPDITRATVKNKTDTLLSHYKYGGMNQVIAAVENELSVKVNRYIKCSLSAVESFADELGGVEYDLKEPLYYKDSNGVVITDLKAGKQTLNGQQIVKFLRFPKWDGGTIETANRQSEIIAAIINQHATQSFTDKMVSIFKGLINSLDTNVSTLDVTDLQAQYNIFVAAKTPAKVLNISGTGDNLYILDNSFKESFSDAP